MMPIRKSLVLQVICILCVICLFFLSRIPEKPLYIPRPPDDLCSINEDLTQACIHPDNNNTKYDDNKLMNDTTNTIIKKKRPYTFVTAASSNHFCALEAMLYIMRDIKSHVDPSSYPRLIVYNLGLTAYQNQILNNLYKHEFFDELVLFNYTKYPDFWDVSVNRGEYAWKPGAVKEVQEKYGGIIVWLDTGDVPNTQFVENMPDYIERYGFWSPRSTGFMGAKFNHIGLFRYFHSSRKLYANLENCNGAALGFDADNPKIVEDLIQPWYDCALNKNCIAPKGSSRRNHRQDQTAISFLALRAGYRCFEYPEFHGLTIHQDDFCKERLALLHQTGSLLTPSSYINGK
ncbi:uncharacterized protein BX664DRAFT_341345 [Halteromyces radiatus]|uniref:uncharacterized protein n=1 Tax=Halteromyces radiatus TaxID=101107 RepID=UPI00221F7E30|nr:uncharacterized protein BX664DRAFT_341345 [Halteromyces radiatus]KAI8079735.1 hypothetical protein BX664DRAFT_341345 [Halteromyces radiatus]